MGLLAFPFMCCGDGGLIKESSASIVKPSVPGKAPPTDLEAVAQVISPDTLACQLQASSDGSEDGGSLGQKASKRPAIDPTVSLFWACANGDFEKVSSVLKEKSDAELSLVRDVRDKQGLSALHFACASGCLPIVCKLCEAPFNSDPRCAFGAFSAQPVAIAARYGHLSVVRYLTDVHGALDTALAKKSIDAWDELLAPAMVSEKPLLPVGFGSGEGGKKKKSKENFKSTEKKALGAHEEVESRRKEVRQFVLGHLDVKSSSKEARHVNFAPPSPGVGQYDVRTSIFSSSLSGLNANAGAGAGGASGAGDEESEDTLRKRRGLTAISVDVPRP